MTYWLVTDSTAAEVERLTGLEGCNTPLGVLVEKPKPFNLAAARDKVDRALHPNRPRCTCGTYAIIHGPRCPFALALT